MFVKLLAPVRQLDPASQSLEEAHFQLTFQQGDMLADSSLGYPLGPRCACEASQFCCSNK